MTNNFTFVDFYGIAYKARLIAEIAEAGDPAWAEELLARHMPFLRDDPGRIYVEGDDDSRYKTWYEVLADGSIQIGVVAQCCGFSKSITIEGRDYDLLINHDGVPNICGGKNYGYSRRDIWIGEDGAGIYYEKKWMDPSTCTYRSEEIKRLSYQPRHDPDGSINDPDFRNFFYTGYYSSRCV